MLIVIVTITIDSQIGYIADFIPEQLSSNGGILTFILIAVIFVITQYLILTYIKQSNRENKARALHLGTTNSIVSIAQYMLAGILAAVILQIIITQQYSIVTFYASYAISFGLWIGTLGLLARAFFSWYRLSNKNTMVLILALSMVAYVINGVIALAEHTDILTQQKTVISTEDVAQFPEFSIASLGSQIAAANAIASGGSLCPHMDRYSQTIISLYQEVGKSQVLDHYGCYHDILSSRVSAFCLGILHSV